MRRQAQDLRTRETRNGSSMKWANLAVDLKIAEDAEAVLRRRVPRFRGLLARRGAVGAAIYLIRAPRPSDTFTDLWAEGHHEHPHGPQAIPVGP